MCGMFFAAAKTGIGVDVAIDCAGAHMTLQEALEAGLIVDPGGHYHGVDSIVIPSGR